MEETKKNKMADTPMKKLFWKMELPMIISMVLQALYNVVDSIFVANMGENGAIANQALTIAFPIQILIIAIGVGTGVGLNTLLSKSLGEKNNKKVNKIAGNGIFLSVCIYAVLLLFGAFGSKWFISAFAGGNEQVISMGTTYLQICCCLSLGSIGYTVYERFLQSTGKTMLSTIAQISGAVTNIVLDYIFIQAETMKLIASEDNCVIVGRGSDYILKDNPNLVRIFLYAPLEYRINKVIEMYKDNYKDAKKHVLDSDISRASYYEVISNQSWGEKENYDLCLNCEIGNDKIVEIICEYTVKRLQLNV